MKTTISMIFLSLMVAIALSPTPLHAWADGDPPWDAPLMPGGKIVKTESTSIWVEYDQTYEQVVAWYKQALEKYKDDKWRDWEEQTYIEDQGGANWHSIGIQKGTGPKTMVKITRDNLTWIFSTLLIRFAGVFLVLCILWVLLNVNSAAMKKFFPETAKAKK